MERKSDIRNKILKERTSLSAAMKREYDLMIAGKVIEHPLFQETEDIFCYIPIRGEVDTFPIISAAWETGKRIAVPRVLSKTEMQFFYIRSYDDLSPGTFGVLEPVTAEIAKPDKACVLAPGSVFDVSCNRIGYGGGYYDRYLAAHREFQTIGLAYSLQVVDILPTEITDIPLDYVLTERQDYHRERQ